MNLIRPKWWLLILILTAIVTWFIVSATVTAKQMARIDLIKSHLAPLAFNIEDFRKVHGTYPESLEQYLSGADPDLRYIVETNLHDSFDDTLVYERLTNGFRFIVIGPHSWFIRWDSVTQAYLPEEAYRGFNVFDKQTNK